MMSLGPSLFCLHFPLCWLLFSIRTYGIAEKVLRSSNLHLFNRQCCPFLKSIFLTAPTKTTGPTHWSTFYDPSTSEPVLPGVLGQNKHLASCRAHEGLCRRVGVSSTGNHPSDLTVSVAGLLVIGNQDCGLCVLCFFAKLFFKPRAQRSSTYSGELFRYAINKHFLIKAISLCLVFSSMPFIVLDPLAMRKDTFCSLGANIILEMMVYKKIEVNSSVAKGNVHRGGGGSSKLRGQHVQRSSGERE